MNNQYIYAISRRRNASDHISNILIDPELILNGVYLEGVLYYIDEFGEMVTTPTDYLLGVGNADGSMALSLQDLRVPFLATFRTTTPSEIIELPLNGDYSYDFEVDWGDGSEIQTITSPFLSDRYHTYADAGDYQVSIKGTMPMLSFDYSSYANKIISIDDIGEVNFGTGVNNFYGMFYGCTNLTSIPLFDTSNGSNFSHMFHNCWSLTTIPLLDTSNGLTFQEMFNGCSNLTSIPLINTSNGSNFGAIFVNCPSLTSIPLIDTSNGLTFQEMFNGCWSLTTIPLIDTSSGTTFYGMFNYCSSLTTIPLIDTSSGTSFDYMFSNCSNLTSIPLINTSSGISFTQIFNGCPSLTTIPELNLSGCSDFSWMFNGCSNLTSIPPIDTSNGEDFRYMFMNCWGLTTVPYLNVSNALESNFQAMFFACSSLTVGALNGTKYEINYASSPLLSAIERENIYNGLADVTLSAKSITMPTSVGEDDSIATLKGWSVSHV